MSSPFLFSLLISVLVSLSLSVDLSTSTEGTKQQFNRWNARSISLLFTIIITSLVIVIGLIVTTIRGLGEYRRLSSFHDLIESSHNESSHASIVVTGEWSEQDLATITKNWDSFAYDERIRFCQLFHLKLDQDTAALFLQIFLDSFASEVDRRVWYYLIDCFHLLYCMIHDNTELMEKMNEAVKEEADKILLNIGKDEMKGESKDISYVRYACYDSMIVVKNKKAIKKVLDSFKCTQFDFTTCLRLAVWTCTAREDKDPSDMRFILKERLQSEKKEEERKTEHEEKGTRRQHLIYAIGSTTDNSIYEYMYNKLISEYQYTPSELVYLFKGGCAFPDSRKRLIESWKKDKKLKGKVAMDKEAHEEIISILSRSAIVEKEVKELEEYVASIRSLSSEFKRKLCFEELHTRASRYNDNSTVLYTNIIKYLDERKEKKKE